MASSARCARSAAVASAVADALVAAPRRCSNQSSRLLMRSAPVAAANSSSVQIFDFLLPRYAAAVAAPSRRSDSSPQTKQQQTQLPPQGRGFLLPPNTRSRHGTAAAARSLPRIRACPFSTTPARQRTQAVLNPQTDEDGKEMALEITPRAAQRLTKLMKKDQNDGLALRIQVESGGCHGFQYVMSLVTLPPKLPAQGQVAEEGQEIREDDTVFVYQEDGAGADAGADGAPPDHMATPKIVLDTPSLELLKGSKVDFTTELIGSQFKIVDNPLATSSCGCGTSFDIKL